METTGPLTLADAVTLTGSSADGAEQALPSNCTAVALELDYAQDALSSTGTPTVGIEVDCGAGFHAVCALTGSTPPFALVPFTVQPTAAATIALVVEVPLPPGAQRIRATYLDADGTNPGDLTLRATPRVGG